MHQVRGNYRGPAWIAAAVVPANLALDLLLLPLIGVAGAGYATAAAIGLQAALLMIGLRGLEVGPPLRAARLPRLALPAVASTAGAWGLLNLLEDTAYTVPGLILMIAAGVVLAAAMFALVLPAEFREFRANLRGRRRSRA